MVENHCWYRLNIDTSNSIKKDWSFPEVNEDYFSWINFIPFEEEWLSYLRSFGLKLQYNILFFRNNYISDGKETYAHIDTQLIKDKDGNKKLSFCPPAINWCVGGENSEAVWYKKPQKLIIKKTDEAFRNWGNPFVITNHISTLEKTDHCFLNSLPILYRVDVPHTVLQNGEKRWAISLRFKNLPFEWNKAVELLDKKGLLIPR